LGVLELAAEESNQAAVAEFSRNRDQLVSISSQKQQYQVQSAMLAKALEELEKTSEKKVFKAIGNILILSDVTDVKKELAEQKEKLDLRIKTLQKQEDSTVQKLNKLKSEIEGASSKASSGALKSKK